MPLTGEPQGAVGYEPETVYEAHVNADVSIYFMFSYRQNVKRVSIMRSDVSDGIWTNYQIGTATDIHYHVPLGTWILRIHVGCSPDWLFKSKDSGTLRSPTISRAWGKHPPDETLAEMLYRESEERAKKTKEEVKRTLKWYEKVKKEEVKRKMKNKCLYHVILFNRKTEEIDFDRIMPAGDERAAVMQAAQLYGKYDSKVHLTIVWQIQYSEYATID